jgi:FAD/FMN-containing dehydrogenase
LPQMANYLAEIEQRLRALDPSFRWYVWGHLGDGNLHLWVPQAGKLAGQHHAIELAVYEPLASRGGSVSGEHGIGTEKLDYLQLSRTPAEVAMMRTLKAALDPRGLLNPGKVLA